MKRFTPGEDAILRQHETVPDSRRALLDAGYDRHHESVRARRRLLGLEVQGRDERFQPGLGRTRAQNRALWQLAERRPTPSEYHRERAAILRGDHEG